MDPASAQLLVINPCDQLIGNALRVNIGKRESIIQTGEGIFLGREVVRRNFGQNFGQPPADCSKIIPAFRTRPEDAKPGLENLLQFCQLPAPIQAPFQPRDDEVFRITNAAVEFAKENFAYRIGVVQALLAPDFESDCFAGGRFSDFSKPKPDIPRLGGIGEMLFESINAGLAGNVMQRLILQQVAQYF